MKVCVCELPDNSVDFINEWNDLKVHIAQEAPDLILFPEMPFYKWVASSRQPDDKVKHDSLAKHDFWISRFDQIDVRYIVYSKPELVDGKYFNTAFVYENDKGHRRLHTKYYFPQEPHFWEDTWYDRAEKAFDVVELDGFKIGVLLCTEMWFTEYARAYGKLGVDLLLCPRATGEASSESWLRLGATLAVISGAYCLSSNKSGQGIDNFKWGGNGWIVEPMTGNLVGKTTSTEKYVTREIDLEQSRNAKVDYPLYVKD
jgi:predicted amidohydrolase